MKHFLFRGGIVTHASSSKCDESWASDEGWNIFSRQYATSTGFDEFLSQQESRYDCIFLNV